MKTKTLYFSLLLPGLVLLGVGRFFTLDSTARADENAKFLKFSHQKHITDVGIDCETCHQNIVNNEKLTERVIPGHDVCATCHDDEVKNKCTFCHYSETPEKVGGTPVRDLNMNHKNHVVDQKIKCLVCHAGVDTSTVATDIPRPQMNSCTTCHNGKVAVNQCENCHRNLATLYPESHKKEDFKKYHKLYVRLGAMENQCQACHSDNFCAQCHDGTNLTKLSPGNMTGMISPRTLGNDKAQALAGQAVHDLNYLYTHAVDAKARTSECQTCHDRRTFCNDCHTNGSRDVGGTLPESHRIPGFVIPGGYGSGGGRHADLAKKDIEQCASCHDAEGTEPACVRCHSDNDGIQHTDPRTHVSGFMNNVHGEWHSDPGATCFVCHTDPNARPGGVKGRGFCGYCHS